MFGETDLAMHHPAGLGLPPGLPDAGGPGGAHAEVVAALRRESPLECGASHRLVGAPPRAPAARATAWGAREESAGRRRGAQLEAALAAVADYREAVTDCFASMPAAAWAQTLPAGHGILVPTSWAELGDMPGRWTSWQHLQGHSGVVPVTVRSGKHQSVHFRFACNRHLRTALHLFALCSLTRSEWARAYYDRQRARGHRHHAALRALAAKWLKILFVLWRRQVP